MTIYFDNEPINEDYVTGLNVNAEVFGDSFKLGSTSSRIFKLSVLKEGITRKPTNVVISDNEEIIATLVVDNIEENDDGTYTYTLTDKMVNLEFYYDASEIFINGSTTLGEIALDICQKAGITLETRSFRGSDKTINWYDNTRTAREYIGYIAELNGGYARIASDGTLRFEKQKQASKTTIDIDECADFKIGERHYITRVVYELGTLKYEYGNEDGNTLYLNSENVFITEESEVEAIYNDIKEFVFYSFTTSNCPVDFSVNPGEVITFEDADNQYPTIASYDLEYFGGWNGGYSLELESGKQEETRVVGQKDKIRNLQIEVDRTNNEIRQTIEEVDGQNQKISELTQRVGELDSKIQDVSDITITGESFLGRVELDSINQSEPIYIKIYPTTENISYLYPRNNLYPSNNLFLKPRIIKFKNKTTNEIFTYELPTDLLIANGVYDEFILDYNTQSCSVNKKVGYRADGSTYVLATSKIVEYKFPTIELTDGDYEISLPSYNNAYLFVRLMAQNIYTTQFTTKAEVSSEINQTANSIRESVNNTFTNYSTTTQMNGAIEVKANEITNKVASTYSTKDGTTDQINSAKAEIKLTTDSITNQVSRKVGNDEIISKINQSPEAVGINANKIELSANDVLNLLAGNEINLSSKNITIKSSNFTVDKNGAIASSSGNIGGYLILVNRLKSNDGKVGMANSNYPSDPAFWAGYGDPYETQEWANKIPFFVTNEGYMKANNAKISGEINATTGTFQNCTITDSCSVPASTVTGVLKANNIPSLSAGKITSGTLSGINVSGGTISGSAISAISVGADAIGINTNYGNYSVGDYEGKSDTVTAGGKTLTFKGGILVEVS